ncbi:MAG: hypothetical protein GF330_04080 [Candidatus Eisenbacteria bacterium]|nr:hypothetical protein [Candidatus Eisenbacteria bacterium]
MSYVRLSRNEKLATVILARDVINAVDAQMVEELAAACAEVARDPDLRSLVLTSESEKFFCIGFDLPALLPLPRETFQAFYQAFNRLCLALYTLPKPTIAALPGHATGGGCILALCCDYRFIAEGRRLIGMPELQLGVPVPYPSVCMLRDLVGSRIARTIMDEGDFYEPEQSLTWGLVDRILPAAQLRSEAAAWATRLGGAPGNSFARIKRSRTQRIEAEITRDLAEREQWFLDCWFSSESRPKLQEAAQRIQRG